MSLCNYNINKIPIKLSNFHKHMLLAWSLLFKHNFSPHRYYIWNNKDILYKNKSLFFFFKLGIILYLLGNSMTQVADCTCRNFKFLFWLRSMQLSLVQFLLVSECCWEALISHGHLLTIWIYLILRGDYAFLQ